MSSFRDHKLLLVTSIASAMFFAMAALAVSQAYAASEKVAVIGFHLDNTSPEATRPDEMKRIDLINKQLTDRLRASPRYDVVPVTSEIAEKIANGPQIGACNGCQLSYGKALGADAVVWGNVQKVSNLILNINVYIDSVSTGQRQFVQSVDIRGNDDRSWSKGLAYLIDNYLLKDSRRGRSHSAMQRP